jgi:hypothetical protein
MTSLLRHTCPPAFALLVGLAALPAPALAEAPTAIQVRVTPTSGWAEPSPDPMGLAYQRWKGRLVVVDSEVEETGLFAGVNVWFTSPAGQAGRSWATTAFSREPTDVAVRGKRTLFISDDNQDRVFIVRRGPDRRWGTADDVVRSFSTRPFRCRDPEGLEFAGGSLFITDGNDRRVYRVDPGPNRRFDGVPPVGDDVVTSFGTGALGLRDPEDLAYDRDTGLLYLISRVDPVIVRTTLTGDLVDQIDLSSLGLVAPAGITLAPGSDDPSAWHVFIADRGIDNDANKGGDPEENDGRLVEFALTE